MIVHRIIFETPRQNIIDRRRHLIVRCCGARSCTYLPKRKRKRIVIKKKKRTVRFNTGACRNSIFFGCDQDFLELSKIKVKTLTKISIKILISAARYCTIIINLMHKIWFSNNCELLASVLHTPNYLFSLTSTLIKRMARDKGNLFDSSNPKLKCCFLLAYSNCIAQLTDQYINF
jgi:hypothetical protein